MKCENERAFQAHLNGGMLLPVYLLYGEESLLIEKNLKRLLKAAVGGEDDPFLLARFDGKQGLSVDELSDAAEALPFMAPRKCVVADDLDCDALGAADLSKLEQLLADPPPTCVLIFTVKSFSLDGKKGRKEAGGAKGAKLLKLCERVGCAARFAKGTAADAVRLAREAAGRAGTDLPADAAAHLVRRCGGELQLVLQETAKLCAYAGAGPVTREQVEAVGVLNVEASVFELSKAVLRRDYAGAMKLIADLMFLREPPTAVLSILSTAFIDLYRAKAARAARVERKTAAQELGYRGREFRYANAERDEAKFSRTFLRQALEVLAQADFALKSERVDDRIILEKAVTQLFVLLRQESSYR